MCSGLPAVATDAGSITEVIDDGRDGVLVPQRDALSLGNAIAALLLDPDRRHRFGREAARKMRQCFEARDCEKVFHTRIRSVVDAAERSTQ
jgi:glycosyltransferase involved in cell wall biosynthesis